MISRLTKRARAWQIATLLILLTVVTRLPSLLHPRAIDDEAVYSVVANEIVDGGRPYIDAIERKPPLLFWTYAAVFAIAGKFNWLALHSVALAWTLGTMLGLYFIGRKLFDRTSGCMAALLYCIYQPWGTWKDLAFNGELLMNLPIVWAWLLALRPLEKLRPLQFLLAGALLCAGFLLKQPAAIAAVPLVLYLLRKRSARAFLDAASVTTGFFGTLAVVIFILKKQGILDEAVYWTVLNHTIPHIFWEHAALMTAAFIAACFPLVLGSVMSIRPNEHLWTEKRAERDAMMWWLAVSVIGAVAGARFYPHYYIQLIPPLALLAAPWFAILLRQPSAAGQWRGLAITILAVTVILFSALHWRGLWPQRQPSEAGRYLAEHAAPAERIFVWGHSAKIYLDARRRPASRYVLTFPLTGFLFGEPVPGLDTRPWIVPGAWDLLEKDFTTHMPAYIVDLECEPEALYPVRDFAILDQLLAGKYGLATRGVDYAIYKRR